MKPKLKAISIRLDAEVLRVVQELARLSGQSVEVVVAVLLALGTLKHQREAAPGFGFSTSKRKR